MFVDTELLRMGAEFSRSASTIVRRGAISLASVQPRVGVFGDFEAAHLMQSALSAAHQVYAGTMKQHHIELDGLAEKASVAATTFAEQDQQAAEHLASS